MLLNFRIIKIIPKILIHNHAMYFPEYTINNSRFLLLTLPVDLMNNINSIRISLEVLMRSFKCAN